MILNQAVGLALFGAGNDPISFMGQQQEWK